MRKGCHVLMLATALVVAGCGGSESEEALPGTEAAGLDTGWTVVAEASMFVEQRAQKARAREAVQALAGLLVGQLEEVLDSHGAAGAVEVCRSVAPSISAEVAAEHGVAIGRTSHRLRNPANTPPAWALQTVDERLDELVSLEGPAGELGVLAPIQIKAGCLMCHGTEEHLSDEAMAAIRLLYPEDRAVGFSEGELRGWFWVEVPAESGTPARPGL